MKILDAAILLSTILMAKNITVPTKHNKNLTLKEIAEIQPGLGTIMMEFGHRFYTIYYAAKGGNWKLAEYELHEMIEASEVAEVTRPKYKDELKEFEDNHLSKLQQTIQIQNFNKFKNVYNNTIKACNDCHSSNNHSYIRYKLPKNPPLFLDMMK